MHRVAYTFGMAGEYVLDTRCLELRRHGIRQNLSAVPCHVLALLCAADGSLVSRTELRDAVWSPRVAGFDDRLNTAIASIRACLGDDIANPRFLRTERGRGYSFIADVRQFQPTERPEEVSTVDPNVADSRRNSRIRLAATAAISVAASVLALTVSNSIRDASPMPTEAFASVLSEHAPPRHMIEPPGPTTSNPEAWDAYRRAMTGLRSIDNSGVREAEVLLSTAVERDPKFGLAHIGLSVTRSTLLWLERSDARLSDAEETLASAREVAGDLPEIGLALGAFHLFVERDYEAALNALGRAAEARPFDADIFATAGSALMRAGRWDEGVKALDRALALDRFNPEYAMSLAIAHDRLRDYERGQRYYSMAAAESMSPEIVVRQAISSVLAGTSPEEIVAQLREAGLRAGVEPLHLALFSRLLTRVIAPRLVDTSVPISELARRLIEDNPPGVDPSGAQVVSLAVASLATALGEEELGRQLYDEAVGRLESDLPADEMSWTGVPVDQGLYARALAGSGRDQEATHQVERILEAFPLDRDALTSPYLRVVAAEVLVQTGQESRALDLLETLLEIPAPVSQNSLMVDPVWDPVRTHPRFVALVQMGNVQH